MPLLQVATLTPAASSTSCHSRGTHAGAAGRSSHAGSSGMEQQHNVGAASNAQCMHTLPVERTYGSWPSLVHAHVHMHTCIHAHTAYIRMTHLVPPDKVLAQAVRVVGRVGCDGGVAQVAGDGLVAGDAPVAAHSTIEQGTAARLHVSLVVVRQGKGRYRGADGKGIGCAERRARGG